MTSSPPRLVTVFGGGGFIGRYVCEALLKEGMRLRVAERHPRRAFFLQPLGAVGQVTRVAADLARPATIERAVAGSDAVINLVGVFKGNLQAIHVDGAARAAEAAREAGASAFVHISAIGADPAAESTYGRTKGEGEAAVRAAFPRATILRPSVVFGPEDEFTNRFARMAQLPAVPVIAGRTRFQPIYVRDLATAIARAALDPGKYGGKSFDLAGPEAMTMHDLVGRIARLAGRDPDLIDLPDFAGNLMSKFGFLPGAPLTRDQWLMLQHDNVAATNGLKAFGIEPTGLDVAGDWLARFHRGGRFAQRTA